MKKTVRIECQGATTASLDQLLPFQGKLKTLTDESYSKFKRIIEDLGFSEPISIWKQDKDHNILNGHQRLETLKRMQAEGWIVPPIPINLVQAKSIQEAKRKVLALTSQYGDITKDGLHEFMMEADLNFDDLSDFKFEADFTMDEFRADFDMPGNGSESGNDDADAIPELDKNIHNVELGQVFHLGNHKLICGDSTNKEFVDKLLGDETPVIMLTDPPYGVSYDAEWRGKALGADKLMGKPRTGKVSNDDRADWFETWELSRAQIAYVWHASSFSDVVMDSLRRADFEIKQQIIWLKTVAAMSRQPYHWKHEPCWFATRKGKTANWKGDRKQTTVWEAASPTHIMSGSKEEKTDHPTQKPVILYEMPIENHTDKGDLIYEPFGGSGTAIIAAEKTGRRCYTVELDPKYCSIIIERWQNFTGRKAELLGE